MLETTPILSATLLLRGELNKGSNNRLSKVDGGKPQKLQAYTKNYRQPRSVENRRATQLPGKSMSIDYPLANN